ncbi:hypothetical protein D0U04_29875 [Bacillus clarus]|uniref:Uncharacterized protein n=1 Tax=Bacillus clarus TaxID=2338372 RepID=A0A090Y9T2_9BACI|nr:hypothetical protein [Bacillus clarus]KFM95249.1 hypothetical protein DJ93_5858 [Bacillus clarus]RFT61749.1 hypothetical protein D0U04_29875 [Bacillus clarus]
MAFRNGILPHHEEEANHLLYLLNYTVKKQVAALQVKDREEYMKWLARATVAREQLVDLFRKGKYGS